MTRHSSLLLLAALGVLSAVGSASAQVDTSKWKCESCPYPKGTSGTVQAGIGHVSDDSRTFGNFTGLDRKGAVLDLGGSVSFRGADGYYADLSASDLGLDIRRLEGQAGREGLYGLKLGYAEIPRYFADGARSPFLGIGGSQLTLPAGYPAADTASMPLGSSLQSASPGYKAQRFDLAGQWIGQAGFVYRVGLRRDVRDGTRASAGSFYNTAAQLVTPIDHTTDQLEVGVSYASAKLQVSMSYLLSQFRNGSSALNWRNPFNAMVAGATEGQLAQAPDNEFQQIAGSVGYQFSSQLRASADFAAARGTQDASHLASTLNGNLVVPALPAASLDGRTENFNGNVKLSYAPLEAWRLNAIYAWDVRNARSAVLAYPHVATDMFVDPELRSNTPFDLRQHRFKLNGDYRGPDSWKFSAGLEWDRRNRNYQEVATTDEATVWGRASTRAGESVSLSLKLAHAERDPSTYGVSTWFGSPQNPLMRKLNLAARTRDSIGARADWTATDALTVGLTADYAKDDYTKTWVGLKDAETVNAGLDLAWAASEQTQLHAFVQSERMRSNQAGSQAYGNPDWSGKVDDKFDLLGVSVKHAAIPDKLDLGADLWTSRARSDVTVRTAAGEPPYPAVKTARDVLKLYARYKLSERTALEGSWWHESYRSNDWHLDAVQPDTVYNLLAFGNASPRYRQNVVRVSLRAHF